MSLIHPQRAKRYIDNFLSSLTEYGHCLSEYPNARYEQLESVYYTHENICLMDTAPYLINDYFLYQGRGRGCWPAWLIALNPDQRHLEVLHEFYSTCHKNNQWIAELAITAVTGEKHDYTPHLVAIRQELKKLKYINIPMQRVASEEEATQKKLERLLWYELL